MVVENSILVSVFGPQSAGVSPAERAKTSNRKFIRSQDHLGIFEGHGTGRILTASEALEYYGLDRLVEAVDYGSAILPVDEDEPSATIRRQRERLGLSLDDIAREAKIPVADVKQCEDPKSRTPIRVLEKVAMQLGLDERVLSVEKGAGGDDRLAVRLKTLGTKLPVLTGRMVARFAEASWVVTTQKHLERLLGRPSRLPIEFSPDHNFGDPTYPAWQHGYWLAHKTRKILGISPDGPIESLRSLCSDLGIPLIQVELDRSLAGATIACRGIRALIVNVQGFNQNVWVRRATIAHELGHLLWDPDEQLEQLRVDKYEEIHGDARSLGDYVEMRANAFAISLLAPMPAALNLFDIEGGGATGIRAVMEKFGVSFTAARFHVWNAHGRSFQLDKVGTTDSDPTGDWIGRENFTVDWFPIESTPSSRRGEFAGLVVEAEAEGLISEDTACQYLIAKADEYQKNKDLILSLYS